MTYMILGPALGLVTGAALPTSVKFNVTAGTFTGRLSLQRMARR